jgi:hypothetical protein
MFRVLVVAALALGVVGCGGASSTDPSAPADCVGGADCGESADLGLGALPVMVSTDSFESADAYDIVFSNMTVVNALMNGGLQPEDIPADALRSYYVDFYVAQVLNGGFSQFVYNSRLHPTVLASIVHGLGAMNVPDHEAIFLAMLNVVDSADTVDLETFLTSDYVSATGQPVFLALDALNDRFFRLNDTVDLVMVNSTWLRSLPNLDVRPIPEMEVEVDRRIALRAASPVPTTDPDGRDEESEGIQIATAIAEGLGLVFEGFTGISPTYGFEGGVYSAFFFRASGSALGFLVTETEIIVLEAGTNAVVARIPLDGEAPAP